MGARYYDPQAGRFLSPDPVGFPAQLDLYAYANGDPVNYVDPEGCFKSLMYENEEVQVIQSDNYSNTFDFKNNWQTLAFGIAREGYNKISEFCARKGYTRAQVFEVGSGLDSNIYYINGIGTDIATARRYAESLSDLVGGARVHVIYNPADSWFCYENDDESIAPTERIQQEHSGIADIPGAFLGHLGFKSPVCYVAMEEIRKFDATHAPDEKMLLVGYSEGGIVAYNALTGSPPHQQQRVAFLGIASGKIVTKDICYKANDYTSERDFVSYLDVFGIIRHPNSLQRLDPKPGASFHDHGFLSPTFDKVKEQHINEHMKNIRGKK